MEEAGIIIDSHAHLKHGDAARTAYTPGATVAAMDSAGIDRAVVFATCTTTRRSIETPAGGFPRTSLIIAHIGKYLCTDDALIDRFIEIAERHANVYLDASGVVRTWKIADAVRRVGASHVLWGTDGPRPRPTEAEFARMELDKVRTCGLGAAESAEVLGAGIARLLGI